MLIGLFCHMNRSLLPYNRSLLTLVRTSGMLVIVGLFCLIIGLFCHLRIPQLRGIRAGTAGVGGCGEVEGWGVTGERDLFATARREREEAQVCACM